jgi:hypothetical protein
MPVEQVRHGRLHLVAHRRAVQVAEAAEAVHFHEHAGELVLVAARASELDLQQVQDLRVREDASITALPVPIVHRSSLVRLAWAFGESAGGYRTARGAPPSKLPPPIGGPVPRPRLELPHDTLK